MPEAIDGWVLLDDGRKVRPLSGWVFVYADEEDKFTESGILIKPQGAREHLFRKGTVLAVSDRWVPKSSGAYKRVPCPIPLGSRCVFLFFYAHHPSAGFRAWAGDNRLIPLKMEDVLLYDDGELEGRGIDDMSFSEGEREVKRETT